MTYVDFKDNNKNALKFMMGGGRGELLNLEQNIRENIYNIK